MIRDLSQVRTVLGRVVFVVISFSVIGNVHAECDQNQIGGLVFRDFNANGAVDSGEPGVAGVLVTAVNSAGGVVGSVQTSQNGSYSLPVGSGTDVRVDFSNLPAGSFSGPVGVSSKSTVVFAKGGACSVNLGLSNPLEVCGGDNVVTTRLINGDPLLGGSAGEMAAMVSFPFGASGTDLPPGQLASAQQIGSTWGVAYQRSTKRLFAAASLKRHAGLGSLGLSGIYSIDMTNPNSPVVSPYARLSDFGFNFGSDPRQSGDLFASATVPSQDPAVWDLIGKSGFGDIEMSEDDQVLYAVNLADRRLYLLNIGNPLTSLTADRITTREIPNPGCSNGNFVPWALKAHRGKLYVGTVCTAEVSKNPDDLRAVVLEFDGQAFSSVAEFSFGNIFRGFGLNSASPLFPFVFPDTGGRSRPWAANYLELVGQQVPQPGAFYLWAQMILSAIEFDTDGSMILGFKDRSGDQYGPFNFGPAFPPFNLEFTAAQGDLVRLCKVGATYVPENNAACPGGTPTAGMNNGQGPGEGEYYYEESSRFYDSGGLEGGPLDAHQETAMGAMVMIPGTGEFMATVLNPFDTYETAGVHVYDAVTGEKRRGYQVYGLTPGTFGKAAGLGDAEVLCQPAPLQIGNRVWRDLNNNGAQDAAEPGIAGVTVTLIDSVTNQVVATKVTAADGTYLFDNVAANRGFVIRVGSSSDFGVGGPLAGLALTNVDNAVNNLDSDGNIVSNEVRAVVQTGAIGVNDHTFDFGFVTPNCTVRAQGDINAKLDGASQALNTILKQAVRRVQAETAKKSCVSNQSAKTMAALVTAQEKLHQTVWQRAWSFSTSTVSCDRVVLSCVTTDLSTTLVPLQAEVATMRKQVQKVLSNRCFKNSSRAVRSARQFKKRADKAVADSSAGVSSLGTSITACPGV